MSSSSSQDSPPHSPTQPGVPSNEWQKSPMGTKQPLSMSNISLALQSVQHTNPKTSNPLPEDDSSLRHLLSLRLADYKQAVYIAPMAKPSLHAPEDTWFPLMDKVKDFLAGDSQVMLILGDSGAGKSTFNRCLEHQLLQNYQVGGGVPLVINLPALERPEKDLVAEQLRTFDFSEGQIRDLKENRQFVLICDGYDESQLTSNLYTTNQLNQPGQWKGKLIITCRTQYLGPDYRDQFVPKAKHQYQRAAKGLFCEAVIAPFSKDQIEDYVERYVLLEPRTWGKEDYMEKLARIPNLMDLVRNPFLLTLCLEALPRTVQGTTDLNRLHVTRVQLYDNFVAHWLEVNKRRLQDQRLNVNEQMAFIELKEEGFQLNGIRFQQGLAAAIFKEQDGRPVVDYIHRRDKISWKAAFFCSDPEITLLRGASLLSRIGTQHRFVHRSILEYFYSCIVCPSADPDEFAPQEGFDFTTILLTMKDHPLSQRDLVAEPSIVRFLSERVQLQPEFKQHLLDIIELSKTNEQAARAAANAITILVRASARFNGSDLRAIRIPGADLSGGQFDSVEFMGANLRGVNFTRSWIRQADFSRAQMAEAHFGELPRLEEDDEVLSCAYSPDGNSLAVGLRDGNISVYETIAWARIYIALGHQEGVTSLAYSPNGHNLLSGSNDKTLRLWTCETNACEIVLEGHTESVLAVAFSPSGKQIASASSDKSVRLWDAGTGAVIFDLIHTDEVSSIAYSPDGRTIVTGTRYGLIWTFDTETGCQGYVLDPWLGRVSCVAFSLDGQQFVTGHGRGVLAVWEMSTGKSKYSWKGHAAGAKCIRFSPSGQRIASSSEDNLVKLWDVQVGTLISVFAGHAGVIESIAFSPDGSQLASGSWDKTVRLWSMNTIDPGFDSYGSSSRIECVAYSPDGLRLITGSEDGTVREHDAVTGDLGLTFLCGTHQANCVAYSPGGHRIATAGGFRGAKVWTAGSQPVDIVPQEYGRKMSVTTISFSPCGRWIATGSVERSVHLWDACSLNLSSATTGHIASVRQVMFSSCGQMIASGSEDGTIRIKTFAGGGFKVLVTKEGNGVMAMAFSPDATYIASVYMEASGNVKLWDVNTGELKHTLHHGYYVYCVSISSCGHWIATGCDKMVWLWSLSSSDTSQGWSCNMIVREFYGVVASIAWRPNTPEFVTGCRDGSTRVWRLQKKSRGWSIQVVWNVASSCLVATDAILSHAVGLSPIDQQLLKQRGAIDESFSSPSIPSS